MFWLRNKEIIFKYAVIWRPCLLLTHLHEERGGSVVECLAQDRGVAGSASLEALRCVLEQDALSSA